jgi:hypothetical protein
MEHENPPAKRRSRRARQARPLIRGISCETLVGRRSEHGSIVAGLPGSGAAQAPVVADVFKKAVSSVAVIRASGSEVSARTGSVIETTMRVP